MMQKLRKLTAVAAVTAIAAAGFPSSPVFAAQARAIPTSETPTVPVDQTALISSTINGFPNGGEPLKLAISDLIVKHRNLASSLATHLSNEPSLTPAQKQAIFAGLADALNRLGIVAADLYVKAVPPAAAEAAGFNPMLIALLALGGAAAGFGIYEATRNENTVFVNPVKSPN
jgi:hypothetical protein